MKEAYDTIDKEETANGIENIKQVLVKNIQKDVINKRLTLNLSKSILSNTYYGQNSFLNVTKTALAYEEQQTIMYTDYVSNIVETGFLHDILEERYSLEEIKEYIEQDEDVLSYALFPQVALNFFKYRQANKKHVDREVGDTAKGIQPV